MREIEKNFAYLGVKMNPSVLSQGFENTLTVKSVSTINEYVNAA